MSEVIDEMEAELRRAARELRAHEMLRAEPSQAWIEFQDAVNHQVVPSRHAPSPRQHRWTVLVVAAAALVLALVWWPQDDAPAPPFNTTLTTDRVVTSTSTASTTTEIPDAGDASPLVLPVFSAGRTVGSLSVVSSQEWFAFEQLGSGPVTSYRRLWRTIDAGRTWVDMQLPGFVARDATSVYFADPSNGWMARDGCCLFSTHDGGVTWARVPDVQPMYSDWNVDVSDDNEESVRFASSDGRVYLLADVVVNGNGAVGVLSSPIDRDEFETSGSTMGDVRWGMAPNSGQLVVRPGLGMAIVLGVSPVGVDPALPRVPDGAAVLVDGRWTSWVPPCAMSLAGRASYTYFEVPRLVLGADVSGSTAAVACSEPTDARSPRTFVSANAGATFNEGDRLPDGVELTERSWVIVTDDGTVLIGVTEAGQPLVVASSDGGATWTRDASFAGTGSFAAAVTTPDGMTVVVATIEDPDGTRRDIGLARGPDGQWVKLPSS